MTDADPRCDCGAMLHPLEDRLNMCEDCIARETIEDRMFEKARDEALLSGDDRLDWEHWHYKYGDDDE